MCIIFGDFLSSGRSISDSFCTCTQNQGTDVVAQPVHTTPGNLLHPIHGDSDNERGWKSNHLPRRAWCVAKSLAGAFSPLGSDVGE